MSIIYKIKNKKTNSQMNNLFIVVTFLWMSFVISQDQSASRYLQGISASQRDNQNYIMASALTNKSIDAVAVQIDGRNLQAITTQAAVKVQEGNVIVQDGTKATAQPSQINSAQVSSNDGRKLQENSKPSGQEFQAEKGFLRSGKEISAQPVNNSGVAVSAVAAERP